MNFNASMHTEALLKARATCRIARAKPMPWSLAVPSVVWKSTRHAIIHAKIHVKSLYLLKVRRIIENGQERDRLNPVLPVRLEGLSRERERETASCRSCSK